MSTTTYKGSIIQIRGPNAGTDWSLSGAGLRTLDALETGIPLHHITYSPGASRDVVVVKERNDGGPEICRFECSNSLDKQIEYFGGARLKSYVDVSAGTHGKGSDSVLKIIVE